MAQATKTFDEELHDLNYLIRLCGDVLKRHGAPSNIYRSYQAAGTVLSVDEVIDEVRRFIDRGDVQEAWHNRVNQHLRWENWRYLQWTYHNWSDLDWSNPDIMSIAKRRDLVVIAGDILEMLKADIILCKLYQDAFKVHSTSELIDISESYLAGTGIESRMKGYRTGPGRSATRGLY